MTRKWARFDSQTLSALAGEINLTDQLTGESGKEHTQFISHQFAVGGTIQPRQQYNGDTAANYAARVALDGGGDFTATNLVEINWDLLGNQQADSMVNQTTINLSAQEKLLSGGSVGNNGNGAGNVPNRRENAYKWVNTSAQINASRLFDSAGTGNFDTDSNFTGFEAIDQAIARFASMREAFQALNNPFNQRFVEWFSGSVLSSIWDQNSLFGSPVFAMVDDINEGFGISHDTTNPSQGAIIAGNTERPFDFDGCVMHTITRRVEANGNTQAGWANRSDGDFGNTPDDSVKFQQTSLQTFIRFVTIRNLSTTVVLTTVPSDTIFHHVRQEMFGASATITIEGKLEATSVTDLPILKLYAGFKENNTGGGTIGEARIRYMEVFNTA